MAKSNALAALESAIGAPAANVVAELVGKELTTKQEKFAALKAVDTKINAQHETKNSLMRLGDKVGVPLPSISTGLVSIDRLVIQCGGIPRGRIIEMFGPESGGKTTIALQCIAMEQKTTENLCAFIDAEHALSPDWAAKQGVNVDDLIISQPDSGEQALDTVVELVKSRAVSLIVVDSVSALVPKAELEGDMGDSHMGLQARMMSQAMRKLRGICNQTGVTVIFINQIREKIGVMFGSPETTSGGRALKFYASVRLDIRRIGQVKDGADLIGNRVRIKCVKNKVGSPFKEVEFDLLYDSGIDSYADWLEVAVNRGVVEKSGSWYSFKTERIGQGARNASSFLKGNSDVFKAIQEALDKVL